MNSFLPENRCSLKETVLRAVSAKISVHITSQLRFSATDVRPSMAETHLALLLVQRSC
jgi:hypothetical protein